MPSRNTVQAAPKIPSTTNEKPAEQIDGFVSNLTAPNWVPFFRNDRYAKR